MSGDDELAPSRGFPEREREKLLGIILVTLHILAETLVLEHFVLSASVELDSGINSSCSHPLFPSTSFPPYECAGDCAWGAGMIGMSGFPCHHWFCFFLYIQPMSTSWARTDPQRERKADGSSSGGCKSLSNEAIHTRLQETDAHRGPARIVSG